MGDRPCIEVPYPENNRGDAKQHLYHTDKRIATSTSAVVWGGMDDFHKKGGCDGLFYDSFILAYIK